MAPDRFCAVIRVYDRLEDLVLNIDIIRKHWTINSYYVLIVSNGKSSGFEIPEDVNNKADKVLDIPLNPGHRGGDTELLKAAVPYIPESSDFTVLLQTDTWLFNENLIIKYAELLRSGSAVWASAEWVEKYWSLATDFAVVKTKFIKSNPGLFDYTEHPETYTCNYLMDNGYEFDYIRECMPVHRPGIIKHFYNAYGGRFRSFPNAGMVTHHIEDLPGSMEEKKHYANICLGRREFDVSGESLKLSNLKLRFLMKTAACLPRSKWFKGKKRRPQT